MAFRAMPRDRIPTERSRAIVAIDEVVRAAIAVDMRDLFSALNVEAVAV
jgi:hypothetical protein